MYDYKNRIEYMKTRKLYSFTRCNDGYKYVSWWCLL